MSRRDSGFRFSKIDAWLLAAFMPVFIYVLITVLVPLVSGDGLLFYSDVEREAGRRAINYSARQRDNKTRFLYVYRVDEVRQTNSSEIEAYCVPTGGEAASDLSDIRFYTVTMSVRKLFSFYEDTIIVDGCNAFGPYADTYKYR